MVDIPKLNHLLQFNKCGIHQAVTYIDVMHVGTGVVCDIYKFDDDPSKDLGIIRIAPYCKTPLQRVLKGDKTVEGYISGKGRLTVAAITGKNSIYTVDETLIKPFFISIAIGEKMQWQADKNIGLIVYEICYPPYEDGRFENILM